MSKSLRLSEKWFHRGLWLVAFIFGGFLTGLGGTIVADLPQVEQRKVLDDFFADRPAAEHLRLEIKQAEQASSQASAALKQAQLKHQAAQSDVEAAQETFDNWVSTRRATQQSAQEVELVARTAALEKLRTTERTAKAAVEAQEQAHLDAEQRENQKTAELGVMENAASVGLQAEQRSQALRVFGYRLALCLPLLGVAGWLFVKKRKSPYWPFVWGFIYFALVAFFVELVPYTPSYGGYVRYIVGIVMTVLIGRYAIVALNRYMERQKLAEQQPAVQRREELSYDLALTRLGKSVCPGCERPVDVKNDKIDFCPHCGIGLFDHCGSCTTRKSAFAPFCHACGVRARTLT